MKRCITVLLAIICSNVSHGQELIKEYVQSKAQQITSINSNDTSYADLIGFGKAIGESRIVMLGEQDHGDAPTFKAKARLIKYLHEQMGFNVLAFESDFYALTSGQDEVAFGHLSIDSLLKNNIFYVWTGTEEFNDTFSYISSLSRTSKPLKVAGIDFIGGSSQFGYSPKNFTNEFLNFLKSTDIPFASTDVFEKEFSNNLDVILRDMATSKRDKEAVAALANSLQIIEGQLKQQNKNSYWMQLFDFFKSQIDGMNGKVISRDRLMALNLKWLLENKYPTEKIIVWAADAHIAKGLVSFSKKPMGMYLSQLIDPESIYSLGFASLQGTYGRIQYKNKEQIPKAKQSSLEYWMNEKAYDFSFIDFRPFNTLYPNYQDKFFMSSEGHLQMKSNWTKKYDGIFYIKNMYPATLKIKY